MLDRGVTFWLALWTLPARSPPFAHADAAGEADAPASLELKTLYVLDAAKGSGPADALLHRAISDDLPAYLWVIEGNDRAIAFYRKNGFELDGVSRPIEPGWPGGRQVRMFRPAPTDDAPTRGVLGLQGSGEDVESSPTRQDEPDDLDRAARPGAHRVDGDPGHVIHGPPVGAPADRRERDGPRPEVAATFSERVKQDASCCGRPARGAGSVPRCGSPSGTADRRRLRSRVPDGEPSGDCHAGEHSSAAGRVRRHGSRRRRRHRPAAWSSRR